MRKQGHIFAGLSDISFERPGNTVVLDPDYYRKVKPYFWLCAWLHPLVKDRVKILSVIL